jgi:hypothetical protein
MSQTQAKDRIVTESYIPANIPPPPPSPPPGYAEWKRQQREQREREQPQLSNTQNQSCRTHASY